jgi:hypothetical protein
VEVQVKREMNKRIGQKAVTVWELIL